MRTEQGMYTAAPPPSYAPEEIKRSYPNNCTLLGPKLINYLSRSNVALGGEGLHVSDLLLLVLNSKCLNQMNF